MPEKYTEEQNKAWQARLPKKKVAVKVILKSDKGNILLVKPDYKDTWQMPGGAVEANEDPRQAARREVKEEVRMDIAESDLQLVDYVFKASEDYLFLIFQYQKPCDETADYSVEDEEIDEYCFIAPGAVADLLPKYYHDFWNTYRG